MFGLASMINHDCSANARVIFDANKDLHLVAKTDIPKFTEITITYCNPILGTPERQQILLKNKLFRCRCKRCQDPTECNSFIYALLCPKCKDYVVPKWSDKTQEFDYKCRKCPFSTTQTKVEKLTDAISAAQKRLLEAKNVRVLRLEELLAKHLKVLPATHSLILGFKSEISTHLATKRSLETIDKR